MTCYNLEAKNQLKEQLAYEVTLLEQVYGLFRRQTALGTPDDAVIYYHGPGPKIFRYATATIVISDWRPGFLKQGSPLIFNIIVKIVDCLVEWFIANNTPPLKKKNQYREKIEQLKRNDVFIQMPLLFQKQLWLKEVFFSLYENMYEYRNTVTHRWQFSVDEQGGLKIAHKDATKKLLFFNSAKLLSLADFFVRITHLLTDEWPIDTLQERHLRHLSDALSDIHGLQKFGQKPALLMDISYVIPWNGMADVDTLEDWLKMNSEGYYDAIISAVIISSLSPSGESISYRLTEKSFFELPKIFTMSDVQAIGTNCELPARVADSFLSLQTLN